MIKSNRTSVIIVAFVLCAHGHAATVDELEARFESSSCAPAADPAHRAALELPSLRRRVEVAQDPPISWLDELARAYELVEDYGASQQVLERVLARRERGAETVEVLDTLGRIGLMQRARGEPAQAETTLLRCTALARSAGAQDTGAAVYCENLLGLAYRDLARYAEAEKQLQAALQRGLGALGGQHVQVGYSHNLLGTLYVLLGDYVRAEEHYLRSLDIRAGAFGRCSAVTGTALHFVADVYDATARHELALRLRKLSLALRERVLPADDHSIGHGLMGMGETLIALERPREAEEALRRSRAIYLRVYGPHHQRSLRSLWSLSRTAQSPQEVHDRLIEGLRDANARDTPEFLWRFQHGYSQWLRAGSPDAAAYFGKEAVNTIQAMRARATGLERELQSAFLQDKSSVYRSLADLLIDRGRLAEAQQVLGMLKQEEFFDFIRRDAANDAAVTKPAFTAAEEPWVKRYAQISGRLATLGARRDEFGRKQMSGLSAAEKAELRQIDEDLGVARKGFVAFLDELLRDMSRMQAQRQADLAKRNIEGLETYQDDLAKLGADVAMLHYVITPERLRIIVTTSQMQIPRMATIDETTLNRRVHEFRNALRLPGSDARRSGKALYDALIAPVAADLKQAGARTLMLSLDGVLRYVPFSALHDGENYLLQNYRIAVLTEAAKPQLTERGGLSGRFAGLGVTRKLPGFEPLPAVKEELEGILKAAPMEGELRLDEAFTAESVREALARKISLLHVASHFVFSPGTETESYLLLGDGGKLTLRDIRQASYNFRGVDLLTLSACNTAMGGGADANGREVEGLGALAQTRGARAVMATLWPVADDSTGLLMQNFYKLRTGERGMTKAEALRQAQLMLLEGRVTSLPGASRSRDLESSAPERPAPADPAKAYAHPYFWAPFILMGNWL